MNWQIPLLVDSRNGAGEMERRVKPRVQCAHRAIVRGMDITGQSFEEQTALENLSAQGLYLRLRHPLQAGQRVFILIRLAAAPISEPVASIATHSRVVRTEPRADGMWGVGVVFEHRRYV